VSTQEPWLRGPVTGVPADLQPVAHALMFAQEELERILPPLSAKQVWERPGDIAPIGYHVRHCMGSIERMLTYIRGEGLTADQFAALKAEKEDRPEMDGAALLRHAVAVIESAMQAIRDNAGTVLDQPREVGRQKLPSTVRGLFGEIAVHTARHVGQIATTAKLVSL
jgi:hypothetical protein